MIATDENTPSFFQRMFDASGFMPRWQCGDWSPTLGWLHIISDGLIFVAYACIPLTLAFFVFRRRDVALKGIVWLFVAFILSCGLTHLLDATMFYHPAYRALGVMKAMTAAVSLLTVVALFRVMPMALSLPGIAEAHKLAQREIERCRKTELELVRVRDELETRGALLTGRLHRARQALSASEVALMSWDAQTGKILWEKGLLELLAALGHEAENPGSWTAILGEHQCAALRDAAIAAFDSNRDLFFRFTLADAQDRQRVMEIRGRAERAGTAGKAITGTASLRPIEG